MRLAMALLSQSRQGIRITPGSYGLLYTLDDEDAAHVNAFRVYVLARGALVERTDPFLSPFVPVVEDPYRDD